MSAFQFLFSVRDFFSLPSLDPDNILSLKRSPIVDICSLFETHANFQQVFMDFMDCVAMELVGCLIREKAFEKLQYFIHHCIVTR